MFPFEDDKKNKNEKAGINNYNVYIGNKTYKVREVRDKNGKVKSASVCESSIPFLDW